MDNTDLTVDQVQALLEQRRMTGRDLVTAAYYHAFEKLVPSMELDRRIRQLEKRPDMHGQMIVEPLPPWIAAFVFGRS